MTVERPRRDQTERPGRSKEKAKERSLVIPLDDEDAMRALARFAYSGEGDGELQDARHRSQHDQGTRQE
ncbi:MAG TPA: hypothetical protein VGN13_11570 [Solirubrobacteraceae bacterium]|jgi:hypothetical protein